MVSASSLLLPSSVRGLASCVSDGAVRVACATRVASLSSSTSSSSSSSSSTLSVAVTYRATTPRAAPPLLLRLVWTHSPFGPPTLSFATASPPAPAVHLRARKGARSVPWVVDHPPLALFWDLTAATYGAASPEPVSGFYVVVAVADDADATGEVVLAVGDLAADFLNAKFGEGHLVIPSARSLSLSQPAARADRVVVAAAPPTRAAHGRRHRRSTTTTTTAMHTARVRFAEGGAEHEVSVGCSTTGSGGQEEEDELWVCVDGKRAAQARRLRWNFRGNQTVFVDGAPVDVMWDLHGWWRRDDGCAVVMLRARTARESRLLWLEEEEKQAAANAKPGFALVVQAFKAPP